MKVYRTRGFSSVVCAKKKFFGESLDIDYAVLYEWLLIYAQSEFFLDKAKKNDKLRFL
jgi:hypothetical protein